MKMLVKMVDRSLIKLFTASEPILFAIYPNPINCVLNACITPKAINAAQLTLL